MYDNHSNEIKKNVSDYFEGIYTGDVSKLIDVFYPKALLFGDINGAPYFKTATAYIDGVKNRKSPKDLGQVFKMKILSIEILGNNAIVKAQLPMLGYNYFDFLSFTKINSDWKIVNKLFTHLE
ncbi:nuclear transport factor 2 family protein [Tenacibaculum sp. Bg11-29]|uniref:nuclear transport factor 2 family protein n=1 Tax=Tenacibaculum sp. Bg11-29 TaxID=2058306 RepID=UPI000C34B034|nr:nuclear transport factor 2 family protein [Tenacibaculum sp. Bg11-29]PKH50504.1 nuclear transport factor 2 family protein [Tenacibaculum sp. Bg11-29]